MNLLQDEKPDPKTSAIWQRHPGKQSDLRMVLIPREDKDEKIGRKREKREKEKRRLERDAVVIRRVAIILAKRMRFKFRFKGLNRLQGD